jgi:hypothetical protein
VITLHLQEGLGFDPLGAALAFLPFSLGVVAGSGAGFAVATQRGLWLEVGLFLASALLSVLLPAGPVQARGPGEAAPAQEIHSAG